MKHMTWAEKPLILKHNMINVGSTMKIKKETQNKSFARIEINALFIFDLVRQLAENSANLFDTFECEPNNLTIV